MSKVKTVEELEQELLDSQIALETANQLAEDLSKTNESLAAENESLKAELNTLVNAAPSVKEKSGVGECFELDGVKYKVLSAAISIPKIGKRTALEILTDTEAQEWLVSNNSGAIKKLA